MVLVCHSNRKVSNKTEGVRNHFANPCVDFCDAGRVHNDRKLTQRKADESNADTELLDPAMPEATFPLFPLLQLLLIWVLTTGLCKAGKKVKEFLLASGTE